MVDIGMTKENREQVIRLLSTLLADIHVLYIKNRNHHWNILGFNFKALHEMFEEQYTEIEADIDELAERIRMLGGKAPGTMKEFINMTRLTEHPGRDFAASEMVNDLLNDYEAVIRTMREDAAACEEKYNDLGTNDFLIGLMQKYEKRSWMLRATLESPVAEKEGEKSEAKTPYSELQKTW